MLDLTTTELQYLMSVYAKSTPIEGEEDVIWTKLSAEYTRLKEAEEYKAQQAAEQAQREANREYALNHAKVGDVIEYQAKPKGKEYSYGNEITRRAVIRKVHVSQNKYGAKVIDMTVTIITKAGEPHKTLNTWYDYDESGMYYAVRVWNQDPTTVKLVKAA